MVLLVGLPESVLVNESGVSPVGIIPPQFSKLIYHLKDEQKTQWRPQFGDVV
jgi:hypothetical protein